MQGTKLKLKLVLVPWFFVIWTCLFPYHIFTVKGFQSQRFIFDNRNLKLKQKRCLHEHQRTQRVNCRQREKVKAAAEDNEIKKEEEKIVIIGGGWSGFGAASSLAKEGFDVTLLEAGSTAGGLAAGWKTAKGRDVEVGIHGFWRCYKNIFQLVEEELKLDSEKIFTPYTQTGLYTKNGLSVVAPVFGDFPILPAPLGTGYYSKFSRLSTLDKLSAAGLLKDFLDFEANGQSWEKYDKMTARELFKNAKVTKRLYEEFLEPVLLVLPMCPGEECSAAAALSLLQYFALNHQADFDVKWLQGSASELIFKPWAESIKESGGKIMTGQKVTDFKFEGNKIVEVVTSNGSTFKADAVISAVGISGAKALVSGNGKLASYPEFSRLLNLKGVDIAAVRLFLSKKVKVPYKSNVGGGGIASGFDVTGLTFYHLNDLQEKYSECDGSVLEIDYYHAIQLVGMADEDVVSVSLRILSKLLKTTIKFSDVEDYSVVRARQGVSHFYPGAFQHLPGLRSNSLENFWFCGDWADRGGHGSWSQEKSLVTGRQVAEEISQWMQQNKNDDNEQEQSFLERGSQQTKNEAKKVQVPGIIEVEKDEPHIKALRQIKNKVSSRSCSFLLPKVIENPFL